MALYRANQALYVRPFAVPDPERYRKDIELFKEFDSKNALPKDPALFVGSSTIMKWKTAECLSRLQRDQPGLRRQRHSTMCSISTRT